MNIPVAEPIQLNICDTSMVASSNEIWRIGFTMQISHGKLLERESLGDFLSPRLLFKFLLSYFLLLTLHYNFQAANSTAPTLSPLSPRPFFRRE